MRRRDVFEKGWKPLAGLGGLVILIAWTSGGCRERVAPGTLERASGLALPADAALFTVVSEPVSIPIDVTGTVVSEETVHLSSRLRAYVQDVMASAGQAVKAGEVLIALDDRELREQLAAAQAQRTQADAEFQRAKRLLETEASTPQAYDAAVRARDEAEAMYERARVALSYARITSPIDGIVTDRRVEVGDLAGPGQVLLAVYDPTRMRLEAAVPLRLVDRLARGQAVDVTLERPSGTLTGIVTEIVGEVDAASRTQRVRIHLEGVDGGVLPGTFGRAWVERAPREHILVPRGVVYRVGQLELVQVVEDGRVYRRLVRTGRELGDRLEILSGLEPGERIMQHPIQEG